MTKPPSATDRGALLLAIGAYITWGLLPLYIHLLQGVPAMQVLAHRVLWSLVLLIGIVLVMKRGRPLLAALRGRTLLYLLASTAMIGINWVIYIWAVFNGHVLEASLGYFINPLITVALGVVVLGERLRRLQGWAIAVAGTGVAILALSGSGALWISLILATTFALYGLARRLVAIDALGGLTMETALLAPLCIGVLVQASAAGTGGFGHSMRLDFLLVFAGVVTALPLLMFAAAARRLRFAALGLLQYISPTLQFLEAVLFFGEPVKPVHFVTFALIWAGCGIYAWDSIRAARAPMPG